jgi:hypothetical protein
MGKPSESVLVTAIYKEYRMLRAVRMNMLCSEYLINTGTTTVIEYRKPDIG